MARMVVIYKTPKDPAAFDKHYFETHVPISKKLPGLRKYEVSQGPIATPAGPTGFHMVATLDFDDMAAMRAAFASPAGKEAAADRRTFAPNDEDLIMVLYDSREV